MNERNLITMAILYIVTLGFYNIIWQCNFQSELKESTGKGFGAAGHFFVSLITFGIYSIYWQYAAGKRLTQLGLKDNAKSYLWLSILGFTVVNQFIMQSQVNNIV